MGSGRVLVIDDDRDILTLMVHLLGGEGYEVAAVSDSSTACEKVIQFSPDVVIMDLFMPEPDGETLLAECKSRDMTADIPIIMLSGMSVPEQIRRCLEKGAEDYIVKPFHPEVIVGHVEKAVERSRMNKKIRNIVQRYLGPGVGRMVMERPDQVRLTGIRRPIVAMFADIRGFSHIVEIMEPEDIVAMLNRLFTELSNAVFSLGGTIDKFMGDGMMAFWGAPLPNDDMESLAVEAALLMMEKVRLMGQERRYPGGLEIGMGIGISKGNAVVGNIGSESRADYTVIGESVNIASRLEKMARAGQILITEEMYSKVSENFTCSDVGEFELKGKTLPVRVYEVIS